MNNTIILLIMKRIDNMDFGKVVKLFLIDGTPNGRCRCELSNGRVLLVRFREV